MAIITGENLIKTEVKHVLQGQQVINVLWWQLNEPVTPGALEVAADVLEVAWETNILVELSVNLALTRIIATDWSTQEGAVFDKAIVPNKQGGRPGGAAPNNVALAVAFRTGFTGRSRRGRAYLGGLDADDLTNSTIVTGRRDNIVTGFEDVRIAMIGSSFTHVVASFISGGAPRANALLTPVTAYDSDLRVDSQRRRLPSIGV